MEKEAFNFAKQLLVFGFIFWFSETLLFIFIEGWHLKATNHFEITCDDMVRIIFNVSVFLLIYSSLLKINELYNGK